MTDNSNNNNDHRPTNLVQFESQEVKHKFGLDKYPNIPTEALIVATQKILRKMVYDGVPSRCELTDIQFMSLEYWAEMCVELLGMRIKSLQNQIDR